MVHKTLGYLASEAGNSLVLALKYSAKSKPADLEYFETLANLIEWFPQCFVEPEIAEVREDYTEFADWYAAECDINHPDELRNESSRIGKVGDMLHVDTESALEIMHERANEMETDEGSSWATDDGGRAIENPEFCSNEELDSMFDTLRYESS
jgi:hypothetical protein